MNIKWPPEETIEYEAKDPTIENGIVITALAGRNTKKDRKGKEKEDR